jgi:hypothetical protein
MIDWLENLGIVGFWFFLIKGIIWLILFFLVYIGIIDKTKMDRIKNKLNFFKKKRNQ